MGLSPRVDVRRSTRPSPQASSQQGSCASHLLLLPPEPPQRPMLMLLPPPSLVLSAQPPAPRRLNVVCGASRCRLLHCRRGRLCRPRRHRRGTRARAARPDARRGGGQGDREQCMSLVSKPVDGQSCTRGHPPPPPSCPAWQRAAATAAAAAAASLTHPERLGEVAPPAERKVEARAHLARRVLKDAVADLHVDDAGRGGATAASAAAAGEARAARWLLLLLLLLLEGGSSALNVAQQRLDNVLFVAGKGRRSKVFSTKEWKPKQSAPISSSSQSPPPPPHTHTRPRRRAPRPARRRR